MSVTISGDTGLAGAATGALNGSLGATTPSTVVATNVNTPNTFGFKNLLIDAGFIINQRIYVSSAALASGAYGHDRWKAGASGGNYSFTQLASSTTITIAASKSLIQVIEDKNVNGTSFVLSWTGTAQARYAVNSATPSGSYAASPILITGQTVGTTMSVEFNTGTLTNPQLELGAIATSFDYRPYNTEVDLCQRYFQLYGASSGSVFGGSFLVRTGFLTYMYGAMSLVQKMRTSSPTLAYANNLTLIKVNGTGYATQAVTAVLIDVSGDKSCALRIEVASNWIAGDIAYLTCDSTGYVSFSAEL